MQDSNMYSVTGNEIWDLFADYVEGDPESGALALSTLPLPANARDALERSLDAFGYGRDALAYVTLLPRAGEGQAAQTSGVAANALDARAQFLLIEGIDPICLIACDDRAVASLEAVYRTACTRDAAMRVFGRPCVLFGDLPALLTTDQGKQRAWALLKTLPRLEGAAPKRGK